MQIAEGRSVSFPWYIIIGALTALLAAVGAMGASEYAAGVIPYVQEMPDVIDRWTSMMIWPGLGLMAVVLRVLPQLKKRDTNAQKPLGWCLGLIVVGISLEVYGSTVQGGARLGAVIVLVGAALQLAGIAVYLRTIWRTAMQSLHRAVYDTLILIGGVWLTGIAGLHLLYAAIRVVGLSSHFFEKALICSDVAFMVGFVFNSLLGIFAAIIPHFLSTQRPGPQALNPLISFNITLVGWFGAAAWSLQFPYTWVRLALSLFSILLFALLLYMLTRLRVYEWMSASITGPRRSVARMTATAAIGCGFVAVGILTGIGLVLGGSSTVVISNVENITQQVLQTGLGTFGLLALYVSLIGPAASTRWSIRMVLTAAGILTVALVGVIMPEVTRALEYGEWYDPRLAYGLLSGAYGLIAVWLASRMEWKPAQR